MPTLGGSYSQDSCGAGTPSTPQFLGEAKLVAGSLVSAFAEQQPEPWDFDRPGSTAVSCHLFSRYKPHEKCHKQTSAAAAKDSVPPWSGCLKKALSVPSTD